LALAFTLALHEVSGFDAPLVIDTPVARVSDRHRESFAKVLAKVGKSGKQILLLFTPDEYTLSVSKWLDQDAASKHEFVLDSTERVARLEDLSGKQGG
jgi:DNA sulfur modification protein DndD